MDDNNLEIELIFEPSELSKVSTLLRHSPFEIADRAEEPIQITPDEGKLLLRIITISVPVGLAAFKALRLLIEKYYNAQSIKEIEYKDGQNRRFRIKGYTQKESVKIIKDLLEDDSNNPS